MVSLQKIEKWEIMRILFVNEISLALPNPRVQFGSSLYYYCSLTSFDLLLVHKEVLVPVLVHH